jgi:uncharacterized protein (TIGR02246 family)
MMRKMSMGAALLTLTLLTGLQARAEDDASIQKRLDEFVAAWNKHDPKALAAVFGPDGDLINPFGRAAKGPAEIEKLFQDEHTGVMKSSTYTLGTTAVRMLDADAAVVDWDGSVDGMVAPDGSAMPPFKHHVTAVLKKQDGQWWIFAVRAMAAGPGGAPAK